MMPIVRFGDGCQVQRAGSACVCAHVSCGVTSGVPTLSLTPGLIVTATAAAKKSRAEVKALLLVFMEGDSPR